MANGIRRLNMISAREKKKNEDDYGDDDEDDDNKVEGKEEEKVFVCDLDDPVNYGVTLDDLQQHFQDPNFRRVGEYAHLILRSRIGKDVKLLLEESSVYLDGVVVDGKTTLEFGTNGGPQKFHNSSKLGYGEQYSHLCQAGLTKVEVTHEALLIAFRKINRFPGVGHSTYYQWLDEIRISLATFVFMFPECTRFRWISKKAIEWVLGDVKVYVADWMSDLVPVWNKVSQVALFGGDCDKDKYAPPPPPIPTGDHVYGGLEVTLSGCYRIWADHALFVKNLKRKRDEAAPSESSKERKARQR